MSYKPLIIKSEFNDYVKLGANVVKGNELDVFIRDFQEIEFQPIVDDNLYSDLLGDLTSKPELQSFLNTYIKPYLISGAYEKFLLWHGRNISQFGIRKNTEDTSEEISNTERAELLADIRRKTNVYLNIMKRELIKANSTFDGVAYSFYNDQYVTNSKPNTGIKQVGKTRFKDYNNNCCGNKHGY